MLTIIGYGRSAVAFLEKKEKESGAGFSNAPMEATEATEAPQLRVLKLFYRQEEAERDHLNARRLLKIEKSDQYFVQMLGYEDKYDILEMLSLPQIRDVCGMADKANTRLEMMPAAVWYAYGGARLGTVFTDTDLVLEDVLPLLTNVLRAVCALQRQRLVYNELYVQNLVYTLEKNTENGNKDEYKVRLIDFTRVRTFEEYARDHPESMRDGNGPEDVDMRCFGYMVSTLCRKAQTYDAVRNRRSTLKFVEMIADLTSSAKGSVHIRPPPCEDVLEVWTRELQTCLSYSGGGPRES